MCFVVNERDHLLGEISIHDVKDLFQEETLRALIIAKDLAHRCSATASPEETLAHVWKNLLRLSKNIFLSLHRQGSCVV